MNDLKPPISDIRIEAAAEPLRDLFQEMRKLKSRGEYFQGYCAALEFTLQLLGISVPSE